MGEIDVKELAKAIAKELYENGIELTVEYREVVMQRNIALVQLEKAEAMVEQLTEAGDWMVDAGENIAGVYRETWNLDDEHPSTAAWDAAVDEWNQSKKAEAE